MFSYNYDIENLQNEILCIVITMFDHWYHFTFAAPIFYYYNVC